MNAPRPEREPRLALTPRALLLIAWRLAGHRGEPRGPGAARLRRRVRTLIAGRPRRRGRVDGAGATRAAHARTEAFLDRLLHTGRLARESPARWARVLDRLQRAAPRAPSLLRHLPNPRRGAAGRPAALAAKACAKSDRAARAIELHRKGFADSEIAARLNVSAKTVERALKGRRARKRTGRRRAGLADISKQRQLAARGTVESDARTNSQVNLWST